MLPAQRGYSSVKCQTRAQQEQCTKSGLMKRGIHELDLLVDSSEISSCVRCQTLNSPAEPL